MKYVRERVNADPTRIAVRYAEDGGTVKDGLIEVRKGVYDALNLIDEDGLFTPVTVIVNDTHYINGTAVYSDNIPEGADILINTYKTSGAGLFGILNVIDGDIINESLPDWEKDLSTALVV